MSKLRQLALGDPHDGPESPGEKSGGVQAPGDSRQTSRGRADQSTRCSRRTLATRACDEPVELEHAQSLPPGPHTAPRPLRRYPDLPECIDNGPPDASCLHTECRYHLAQRGHWEHVRHPTRDCAIDVANEGPHTQDEVGAFLGVSGERVRQIEEQAFEQLKHNMTMKELRDELSE